jgi:hypothetical protein
MTAGESAGAEVRSRCAGLDSFEQTKARLVAKSKSFETSLGPRVVAHRRSASLSAAALDWIGSITTKPLALALLWAVALVYFGLILSALPGHVNQWDFSHYYASALALRQGHNPYFTDLAPIGRKLNLHLGEIAAGTYPPTFLLCFEPLTLLGPAIAYWVWIAITLVALAAALVLLFGQSSGLKTDTALTAAALALIFVPLEVHFHYAQCQILILLMLVGMARLMERGYAMPAGVVLAGATLLRAFPIMVIGYLAVRRRWRELLFTVCALIAGGLLTLMLFGVHWSFDFVYAVRFVTSPTWLEAHQNVALDAFIMRQFQALGGTQTLSTEIARLVVTWAARLAILGLTIGATITSKSDQGDSDWRCLALWITAMILLSPTAWTHYLVILLFPYAVMVTSASHGRGSSRAAAMMIISYVLIDSLLIFVFIEHLHIAVPARFRPPNGSAFLAATGACGFLSLVSAWLACYWLAVDERTPRTQPI